MSNDHPDHEIPLSDLLENRELWEQLIEIVGNERSEDYWDEMDFVRRVELDQMIFEGVRVREAFQQSVIEELDRLTPITAKI